MCNILCIYYIFIYIYKKKWKTRMANPIKMVKKAMSGNEEEDTVYYF